MNRWFRVNFVAAVALGCAAATLLPAAGARAQLPEEQMKIAGSFPLTTEFLAKVENFAKACKDNAGAKAEWAALDKDPAVTPETITTVIDTKYPKLSATLKGSDLSADDFTKGFGVMAITPSLAEMGSSSEDSVIQANMALYKAEKERYMAVMGALEQLSK